MFQKLFSSWLRPLIFVAIACYGISLVVRTYYENKCNKFSDKLGIEKGPERNTFAHIFTSICLSRTFGTYIASIIGFTGEIFSPPSKDSEKDIYNNTIGREIYQQTQFSGLDLNDNEYAKLVANVMKRNISANSSLDPGLNDFSKFSNFKIDSLIR